LFKVRGRSRNGDAYNIECPAQVVERMIHFASKDAMDIRGFGEANVRKFYELGLIERYSWNLYT
jgi:NAD-dependent DNA ligase